MLGNFVKETTTTSGTGNITVASSTGRARFSDCFAVNLPFFYSINDGNNWELGVGYLSATSTLVRAKILSTLVSGTFDDTSPSAITLSGGTCSVYATPCAQSAMPNKPHISVTNSSAGYMISNNVGVINAATMTATVDRQYYLPYYWDCARPMSLMGFRVSSAAAAGKVSRIGLYSVDENGEPDVLLVESTDIAVDSSGVKTYNFTDKLYPPGWYCIGLVSNGAPVYNSPQYFIGNSFFGTDSTGVQSIPFKYSAQASWSAMPNPANSTQTAGADMSFPTVFVGAG